MSINRSALIQIASITQLVEETYEVEGVVVDPGGIFSALDFAAGDVLFDSGFLGDFRWRITKINSVVSDVLNCNVSWDDTGDPPTPDVGPAAGVGAICSVNENGMAFAPTIDVGEAFGYTERLASNIKNMDLGRVGDAESDKEEELVFDLLGETEWADLLTFDVFRDEAFRDPADPFTTKAFVHSNLLKSGKLTNTVYGWTSKVYNLSETITRIALTTEYDFAGGSGTLFIQVSVDNGLNYTTVLDTGLVLDKLNEEIVVGNPGSDVIVKLELKTDGSGVGGFVKFFGLILGI